MEVAAFERSGGEATQSGRWSVAGGEQAGTFSVNWLQSSDGMWRIVHWRFDGG
jgi:hypothetical protein